MKLFKTAGGVVAERDGKLFKLGLDWDQIFLSEDLAEDLDRALSAASPETNSVESLDLLPPIGAQEVWAAGVTYFRSRTARMEEAEQAGGGSFYDRVYAAVRPELFFKATPHRVAGHLQNVRIRSDGKWNVPEPELTLALSASGKIIGCTIGNDMSSRDIEGENPLYLPQAKCYDKSCALGPGVLISDKPIDKAAEIRLQIFRGGDVVSSGSTAVSQIKRGFMELAEFLFRDNSFPRGCFLMTGTGIVPPNEFTLRSNDRIEISIDGIGTLVNTVA